MKKKTIMALAALLAMGQGAWAQATIEGVPYTNGHYEIADAAALDALATYVNAGNNCEGLTFVVTADITYGESDSFSTIGYGDESLGKPFKGTFDGGDYTITGIKVGTADDTGVGLFGYIAYPAVIKNVKLDGCSFTGGFEVGAIAGACSGYGDDTYGIFDCTVGSAVDVAAIGMTDGNDYYPGEFVGGIIGSCCYMTLSNCTSAATVTGDNYVGGITGRLMSGKADNMVGIVEDCYATGSVTGTEQTGDAIGLNGPSDVDEAEATKGVIKLTIFDDDSEATVKNAQRLNNYSRLACDVTLSGRTLYKDGHWNTLHLPFQVRKEMRNDDDCPLKDATIMKLASSSFEEGKLTLNFEENTSHTPSNQAYIVKWASGENITDPVFKDAYVVYSNTSISTDTYVDFKGSYTPKSLADNTVLYLGDGDKLYYPGEGTTINAFRGYFQLNGIAAGEIAEARLLFGDNEATGVTTPLVNRNGGGGEAFYTLDGRRLIGKPSQKGIYIHNGKKTIIK